MKPLLPSETLVFTKGQKVSDVDEMCAQCDNMGVQKSN